jgi:hypothetical protein
MEREVIELEKQIQLHMSSRADSLESALKTTAACASDNNDCKDANNQIRWKVSKDKYEQGAMQAILKNDDGKLNSTQTGVILFRQYAVQANRLSGLHSLSALNKESSKLVKLHDIAERESLEHLRQEEYRISSMRMKERREQEAKQAKEQRTVTARTESHMAAELARMNGAACGTAGCEPTAGAGAGAPGAVPATERAYRQDFARAEGVEELRRRAFLANELALHDKVRARRRPAAASARGEMAEREGGAKTRRPSRLAARPRGGSASRAGAPRTAPAPAARGFGLPPPIPWPRVP